MITVSVDTPAKFQNTNPDSEETRPMSDSTNIGRRIGVSRRAVTNALAGLRKRGLLRLIHLGGLTGGVSVYRVQPLAKPTG